jgi:hypothetical protein
MSEFSYQLNVERGVTGPATATCLLASLDRISEVGEVRPQTYERYTTLQEDQAELQVTAHELEGAPLVTSLPRALELATWQFELQEEETAVKQQLYTDLGAEPMACRELRLNKENLGYKLGKLAIGGFRVAVCLDVGLGWQHAVGVTKNEDGSYQVRSNWTPFADEGRVSIKELAQKLDRPPRQGIVTVDEKVMPLPNLYVLPPEAKRRR